MPLRAHADLTLRKRFNLHPHIPSMLIPSESGDEGFTRPTEAKLSTMVGFCLYIPKRLKVKNMRS